jgi:hypothetical protein
MRIEERKRKERVKKKREREREKSERGDLEARATLRR